MLFSKKSKSQFNQHRSWRDYQSSLPKNMTRKPRPKRRIPFRFLTMALFAVLTLYALIGAIRSVDIRWASTPEVSSPAKPESPGPLDREQVRQLLDQRVFSNLKEKHLSLPAEGGTLHVETTIDPNLQNYLLDTLDRVNSRYVGIVVMEPLSGRVLALAGYDRTDSAGNPCLQSQFPAASIFKIVTAAAAIDQCGFSADSPMNYRGSKHTLYKGQLTDKVDRHTTTIPLHEAFADSINPVFGKLGELRLRKPLLEQAAAAFGFNQPLDVDVALPPSQFEISDTPYNWAEVASGFNQQTTISPLHGAALAAAILSGGQMVTPTLVEHVAGEQGEILYRRPATPAARQIMSARAADELIQMMESTVASGTARKAFRGYQKDKVLAPLQIGGKTGSIGNPSQDVRYDWFVGFARERQGGRQLVVSVMVGHEEFIGIRAGDYARRAMTYYFKAPAASGTSTAESGASKGDKKG